MQTFNDYSLRIADHKATHAKWKNIWRLGVIVFTRPEDKICKEIITPSLNYLHEHTGEKVHFYFVGYYDGQCSSDYTVKAASDLFGDGTAWYFSPGYFSHIQEKFEQLTDYSWEYSGGTDLLVVPYRIRMGVFYIDAAKALDIKLSEIVQKSKEYTPEKIVQIIVRQLKKGKNIDGVSNSRIMDGIKEGLKSSLLKILPGGLANCYSVLEPFAVRDIT